MNMKNINANDDKFVTEISKHNAREKYVLLASDNPEIKGATILERNGDTFWIQEDDVDMTHKYSVKFDELTEIFDGIRPYGRRIYQVEKSL